jgi:hypothetical protein
MEVSPVPKSKKEEVLEQVHKQISHVLAFKQAQYELKKHKVRDLLDKETHHDQLSQE